MVSSYESILQVYRRALAGSSFSNSPVVSASLTFSDDLSAATARFQTCLRDLISMCDAMDPLVKADAPEDAAHLVANFFSSFSRQLCSFYDDLSRASSLDGALFQSVTSSSAPQAEAAAQPEPLVPTEAALKPLSPLPAPSPRDGIDAEEGEVTEPKKTKRGLKNGSPIAAPDGQLYIRVTTTVERALGSNVLKKRPDVFSPLNRNLLSKKKDSHYFLQLSADQSISQLVTENYVNQPSESREALAYLLFRCPLSELSVGPFQSSDATSVSPISSPCGWRTISSFDGSARHDSMYMFLSGPLPYHNRVFLHDVLSADGSKEEAVHVMEVMESNPQIVEVNVYLISSAYTAASVLPTFIRTFRSQFAVTNYSEVSKLDVTEAAASDAAAVVSSSEPTADQPRQYPSNQQHTSIGSPSQARRTHSPFRMSQVAMSVLSAPLTVGKVVIAGVNDAMKSNMEASLRRACPQFKDAEVLDASSCAWTRNKSRPTPGFFFLLSHCMCLLPSSAADPEILDYEEIKEVKKSSNDRGGLEVTSHLNERLVVVNLADRDASYSLFMKSWLDTA